MDGEFDLIEVSLILVIFVFFCFPASWVYTCPILWTARMERLSSTLTLTRCKSPWQWRETLTSLILLEQTEGMGDLVRGKINSSRNKHYSGLLSCIYNVFLAQANLCTYIAQSSRKVGFHKVPPWFYATKLNLPPGHIWIISLPQLLTAAAQMEALNYNILSIIVVILWFVLKMEVRKMIHNNCNLIFFIIFGAC